MTGARVAEARSLLTAAGLPDDASAAGMEGEVLAVRAEPGHQPALARLAPELRRLGFRYVALELAPGD